MNGKIYYRKTARIFEKQQKNFPQISQIFADEMKIVN